MPNLFRRRPREPPSTGSFNNFASRKRQPVDPPPSRGFVKTGPMDPEDVLNTSRPEPDIQLTGYQLELLNQRNSGNQQNYHAIPHPKDPSDVGVPALEFSQPTPVFAARGGARKSTLVSDDDFLADYQQPDSHPISLSPKQNENNNAGFHSTAACSKNPPVTFDGSEIVQQRPFTTRSNTEAANMPKNITSLASRRAGKERRSISAARSSVFRHGMTTDNDTVTSKTSQKTNATGATDSHHIRASSSGTGSAVSAHDKTELRKLLMGAGLSEPKPPPPTTAVIAPASKPISSKPKPTISMPPPVTTAPSTDEEFDQREYLRNLIQQKGGPKSRGPSTTPTIAPKTKPRQKPKPAARETTENFVRDQTSSKASGISNTTTGHSSSSSSVDPMLQRVLNRSLNASKDRARRLLSPRSKGSKSPKSFSSPEKITSPKRGKTGLKNYVRKKMGFSKKSSGASPRSAKVSFYDTRLAKSTSTDSGDQSVPQVTSMATDVTDGDNTRTTLASSSTLSDDGTKRTYDSNIKQLTTAETLDTDTSSTIMGNLQTNSSLRTASSDSMQYSSEEGCDDASGRKTAFKAINKLTSYARPIVESTTTQVVIVDEHLAYPSDNQGYNTFLTALQLEASGTHSQMWSSFESVMTGSSRKFPHRNGKISQFKFDPPTKKMLGAMNLHLKRKSLVECVSEAQLVNDKQFSQEVEKDLSIRKAHFSADLKPLRTMGVIFESDDATAEKGDCTEPSSSSPKSDNGATIIEGSVRDQQVLRTESETPQLSQPIIKFDLAQQKDRLGKAASMPESNTTLATQIAAVKLGKNRRSAGSRQSLPSPNSSTETDGSLPWSGVQLRSVSSTDESDTPSDLSPVGPKRNTMPSPWARVKLRRIPDEAMEPIERAEAEQCRMQEHDSLGIAATPDSENNTLGLLLIPEEKLANSEDANNKRTVTPDPISDEIKRENKSDQEDSNSQTTASKNLATPVELSGQEKSSDKHTDESIVIFELKTTQGMPQEKVAVGKKIVELYHTNAEPSVSWSLPRDEIKSLKLDMESQSVNLSLSGGGEAKILSFKNSTDCLQFANAFYEMHKPSKMHASEQGLTEKTPSKKRPLEELNDEEQHVLETYRQARRTRAPEEARRVVVPSPTPKKSLHESLLASVIGVKRENASSNLSAPVKTSPSLLSPDETKVAESYEKMLRMRIPLPAVQHKMLKDGVDSKIVDYIMSKADDSNNNGSSDEPAAPKKPKASDNNHATNLTAAEEAIAAPFRKMLKMMIPKEGVRHKMMKDQVDAKIIDAVVGSDDSSSKEEAKLTLAEKATVAKYTKMLKLQMPREAVRHNMEKDQVSEKVIGVVLGTKGRSASAAGFNQKSQASERGSKLVSLHWTPLSGKELDNSVWAAKKNNVAPTQPEGSDISKLVELFQKKSTVKKTKTKGSESDNGIGKAKLIDLNRANIVAISLKAFKDFSHDELANILQNVDPDHKLHGERVQFVRDLLPTTTEISAIKRYYGGPERLVPAEQWFQKIVHIKRLEAKAHVLHTMEVFESEVAEIQERLQMLTRVCTQVMESERLRELLDMVLQIGNIMNEGTRTGGASGFKFDSLLRLTQTKSGDGKTTVLDYMVTIYFAKDQKQTLALMEDFPDCQGASRMLISDLVANVKDVSDKLLKCKKEYESLLSDKSGVAGLKKVATSSNACSDPHQQLFAAITAKADPKPEKRASVKPALQGTKCDLAVQGGGKADKPDGLQAGIAKLNGFLTNADRTYEKLKQDCDLAVETCREMSQYCGESGGERSTDSLLGVLSEFASKLASAVKKHERVLAAEAKKQSRQTTPLTPTKKAPPTAEAQANTSALSNRVSGTPPQYPREKIQEVKETTSASSSKEIEEPKKAPKPRPSPESNAPRGKGTSLVLMVNELLKDSSEETKRDFSEGVVYNNPDDKLKAIYEREKRTGRKGMPPLPRRSMDGDLMATIRRRNGATDGVAAKAKRSQLEKVIDCINCGGASDSEIVSGSADSETLLESESDHPVDKFAGLQSKWKDQISRSESNRSLASFAPSEDEGSVCNPIDCSDIEDDAVEETGCEKPNQGS